VIEATIVLEAWAGRPAETAMSAARGLVPSGGSATQVKGRVDAAHDDDKQQTVLLEGIALVMSIVSVAAWATPLGRLGAHVFADAIRVALPLAVALQWGLRSRYLSLRSGLALLSRDGAVCCVLFAALVELPLVLMPRWGQTAAMLVAIWVGGAIMTRRGWGLVYALALVASAAALDRHVAPLLVLVSLTAFTTSLCLVAVLSRRKPTDERPGSAPRALLAAILGGCVGALLVADPTLGWGVHGRYPAIALIPSVIASIWGGYYMWNLHVEVPRGLCGVSLDGASRRRISDPAMALLIGAIQRVVAATIVLSALVIVLGHWTQGTDRVSVFVAFGCVALVSLLLALLESLGRRRAALIAASAALAVELLWPYVVTSRVSGGPLIGGAIVGLLLALPPLIALLLRSGRVLATTLWIH
jgi:hypothetical protein